MKHLLTWIIDILNGMPPKKMMRERFGLESRDILSYQEEDIRKQYLNM